MPAGGLRRWLASEPTGTSDRRVAVSVRMTGRGRLRRVERPAPNRAPSLEQASSAGRRQPSLESPPLRLWVGTSACRVTPSRAGSRRATIDRHHRSCAHPERRLHSNRRGQASAAAPARLHLGPSGPRRRRLDLQSSRSGPSGRRWRTLDLQLSRSGPTRRSGWRRLPWPQRWRRRDRKAPPRGRARAGRACPRQSLVAGSHLLQQFHEVNALGKVVLDRR
jgi:hypothetical protein